MEADKTDPFKDPWEASRELKRAKTEKNVSQRLRNLERSGDLPGGTARRTIKDRAEKRAVGIEGNRTGNAVPAGIAIDLKDTAGGRKALGQAAAANAKAAAKAGGNGGKALQRGKELTMNALKMAARSTASLGKFDEMRSGEPARRKTLEEKRKGAKDLVVDSSTGGGVNGGNGQTEKARSLKILQMVLTGSAKKDKAKKAGKAGSLAKGETGYDYDYDDGKSADFKKKKGRAGQGKVRKMTKKDIR